MLSSPDWNKRNCLIDFLNFCLFISFLSFDEMEIKAKYCYEYKGLRNNLVFKLTVTDFTFSEL